MGRSHGAGPGRGLRRRGSRDPGGAGGARLSPVRTCIGCRTRRPGAALRRVSIDTDGTLVVGPGPGRGAWLCDDMACFESAKRRRAFGRALRADVRPDEIARLQQAWPASGNAPGLDDRAGRS